jgi:hypothetical protein
VIHYIDTRNGHVHKYMAKDSFFGALFFGPFYFLFKGMLAWFLIACFLNAITFGFAWIFVAAFAPMIRKNHLLNQGLVEKKITKYNKPVINQQRIEPCL